MNYLIFEKKEEVMIIDNLFHSGFCITFFHTITEKKWTKGLKYERKIRNIILLTSSKNQIYEFRIPNIYNYFF